MSMTMANASRSIILPMREDSGCWPQPIDSLRFFQSRRNRSEFPTFLIARKSFWRHSHNSQITWLGWRKTIERKIHASQRYIFPERLWKFRFRPDEAKSAVATTLHRLGHRQLYRFGSNSQRTVLACTSRCAIETIRKQERRILLSRFQRTIHSRQSRPIHSWQPGTLCSHSRPRWPTSSAICPRDWA